MAEEQSPRVQCAASRGQCGASAFCSRFPRRRDTPAPAPVPTDTQALASSLPVTSLSLGQEMPSFMALDLWSSKCEKPPICYRPSDPGPLYYRHADHLAGLEPPLKAQGLLDRAAISYHVSVKDGVTMAICQVPSRQISPVCDAEQCTTGFSIWGINKAQKINDGKMLTMTLNFIKTMSVSFWFNTINI